MHVQLLLNNSHPWELTVECGSMLFSCLYVAMRFGFCNMMFFENVSAGAAREQLECGL